MKIKNLFYLTIILLLNSKFCVGMDDKELLITTSDNCNEMQIRKKETTTFDCKKMNIEDAEVHTKMANSAIIIVNEKKELVFVKTKEDELEKLFEKIKVEILEVTKFYHYYKILIYIDKSIALISEFKETPNINLSINVKIRREKIDLIAQALESARDLCKKLKEIFCENKCRSSSLNYQYMWDGLCNFEKRIEFINAQFERHNHNELPANIYQHHNANKCQQLKKLQEHFENVRKAIYPMKEEDIKKHTELLKNNLLTDIFEIYQNLKQCHEKEKTNLKWHFDILDNILEDIKKNMTKLIAYNEIFEGDETRQE